MSLQKNWNKLHGLLRGTGKTMRMVDCIKNQLQKTNTPVLIICRGVGKVHTGRIRYLLENVEDADSRVHYVSLRTFIREAVMGDFEEGAPININGFSYERYNVFLDHECYEYIIERYTTMTQSLYKHVKELFE